MPPPGRVAPNTAPRGAPATPCPRDPLCPCGDGRAREASRAPCVPAETTSPVRCRPHAAYVVAAAHRA
ncbi:MAG: hypothetical protein ACK559_16410 [bacterium]